MDAPKLRLSLASFLGEERFRKFVQQLNRAGRLRFWQEQAWEKFVAAHPDCAVDLDQLLTSLRICEVHGAELQPDTVEVIDGCVDYADWYVKARCRLFPHSMPCPVFTEGAPLRTQQLAVWYCPQCRLAEAEWRAGPISQAPD